MTEHCIFDDYEIRGQPFEVWTDGYSNPGECPNWWLVANHMTFGFPDLPHNTCLTGEELGFNPPLSDKEVDQISIAVADWFVD